ncbi:MAG: hypothetical protein COY66_04725 [Candidatus Kerfeldbacteria bacterium CG_4_10_14_0_8_um_filter_42_10]|uniref:Lipoprotein n=1 Tax=Candidatus Kerfeldbacteria bacterium CG_4_10_14_0_8_um_filter_42_10 TaxID=2014248 RepID=A0A2M7RHJ7_9BACT|nr:MAG: hypothetical protein COY66_04725 [Candidatus Kerfeldbacteria bacterium CG_4_10_14_0_8_um_filter_42_10]
MRKLFTTNSIWLLCGLTLLLTTGCLTKKEKAPELTAAQYQQQIQNDSLQFLDDLRKYSIVGKIKGLDVRTALIVSILDSGKVHVFKIGITSYDEHLTNWVHDNGRRYLEKNDRFLKSLLRANPPNQSELTAQCQLDCTVTILSSIPIDNCQISWQYVYSRKEDVPQPWRDAVFGNQVALK